MNMLTIFIESNPDSLADIVQDGGFIRDRISDMIEIKKDYRRTRCIIAKWWMWVRRY